MNIGEFLCLFFFDQNTFIIRVGTYCVHKSCRKLYNDEKLANRHSVSNTFNVGIYAVLITHILLA